MMVISAQTLKVQRISSDEIKKILDAAVWINLFVILYSLLIKKCTL